MQEKTLKSNKKPNNKAQDKRLKYDNYSIVFQEVPGETTLAINTTGCPHICEGCHSSHLQKYYGNNLVDDFDEIMKEYAENITCVCFMGGEQYDTDMKLLLKKVSEEYKLKTCIYSGEDTFDLFNEKYADCYKYINYLKIGSYKKELGGLDSPKTNQIFFKVDTQKDKLTFFHMNELFKRKYTPPKTDEECEENN